MTDDHSRIARLEEWGRSVNGCMERMATSIETMADKVSSLETMAEAAEIQRSSDRERIERMEDDLSTMHDTVVEWTGAIKFVKWALGFIGIGTVFTIIGFVVQLAVGFGG